MESQNEIANAHEPCTMDMAKLSSQEGYAIQKSPSREYVNTANGCNSRKQSERGSCGSAFSTKRKFTSGKNSGSCFSRDIWDMYFPNGCLEDNKYITRYEGYWLRTSFTDALKELEARKVREVLQDRLEEGDASTLTQEEEIKVRRLLKKEKRREQSAVECLFNSYTSADESQGGDSVTCEGIHRERKCVKKKELNKVFGDDEVTKFQGSTVRKEAVDKIKRIDDHMRRKGFSDEYITDIVKKERRREEKSFKRVLNLFCYKCRDRGHRQADCPNGEPMSSIVKCYKCGSLDHTSKKCSQPGYQFATCFICSEKGHIAKDCSQNPNGLYPNGGCCIECGSVQHLKKDCPAKKAKKEKKIMKLDTINPIAIEELGEPRMTHPPPISPAKRRIVRF